jgi:branched-subunit amino acid aminotransferase/4-amino-4-deoxychorismate lyase
MQKYLYIFILIYDVYIYKDGFVPIKLYADTENIRAWPGGTGNAKMGGNYVSVYIL